MEVNSAHRDLFFKAIYQEGGFDGKVSTKDWDIIKIILNRYMDHMILMNRARGFIPRFSNTKKKVICRANIEIKRINLLSKIFPLYSLTG